MDIWIYGYIYIERERCIYTALFIHIYIYIYTHIAARWAEDSLVLEAEEPWWQFHPMAVS